MAWITSRQAAARLGVSSKTMVRRCKQGDYGDNGVGWREENGRYEINTDKLPPDTRTAEQANKLQPMSKPVKEAQEKALIAEAEAREAESKRRTAEANKYLDQLNTMADDLKKREDALAEDKKNFSQLVDATIKERIDEYNAKTKEAETAKAESDALIDKLNTEIQEYNDKSTELSVRETGITDKENILSTREKELNDHDSTVRKECEDKVAEITASCKAEIEDIKTKYHEPVFASIRIYQDLICALEGHAKTYGHVVSHHYHMIYKDYYTLQEYKGDDSMSKESAIRIIRTGCNTVQDLANNLVRSRDIELRKLAVCLDDTTQDIYNTLRGAGESTTHVSTLTTGSSSWLGRLVEKIGDKL